METLFGFIVLAALAIPPLVALFAAVANSGKDKPGYMN